MRKSQAFESTYMRTEDLNGKEHELIIDKVEMAEISNPETKRTETKPVVYFKGREKGLILNHTNWDALEQGYGEESDHWHGWPMILYPTTTRFGSSNVACMRIRIPKASTEKDAPPSSDGEAPPPGDADAPPNGEAESAPF